MIDSHIHADTRPYEDFELMATCMEGAVTLAHDPLKMRSMDVLLSHFDRILENEVEKAAKNGLKLYVCIGVHPRAIPPNLDFEVVKEYLKKDPVVGVGEIGLEKCTKEEIDVFTEQILIAKELKMPVVVHTPRRNKEAVTKEILEILDSLNLDKGAQQKIVIEHCIKETVKFVFETEMFMGLTVQPSKLTPMEAVDIVKEYGGERFMLNSDSSSAPSDVLSVAKTVVKMKSVGIDERIIKTVSHDNATKFFGLDAL